MALGLRVPTPVKIKFTIGAIPIAWSMIVVFPARAQRQRRPGPPRPVFYRSIEKPRLRARSLTMSINARR